MNLHIASSTLASTPADEVFRLVLDDLEEALAKHGIDREALTEEDMYELRKRVGEGMMAGSDEVFDAAVDCMLMDRERRDEPGVPA